VVDSTFLSADEFSKSVVVEVLTEKLMLRLVYQYGGHIVPFFLMYFYAFDELRDMLGFYYVIPVPVFSYGLSVHRKIDEFYNFFFDVFEFIGFYGGAISGIPSAVSETEYFESGEGAGLGVDVG